MGHAITHLTAPGNHVGKSFANKALGRLYFLQIIKPDLSLEPLMHMRPWYHPRQNQRVRVTGVTVFLKNSGALHGLNRHETGRRAAIDLRHLGIVCHGPEALAGPFMEALVTGNRVIDGQKGRPILNEVNAWA